MPSKYGYTTVALVKTVVIALVPLTDWTDALIEDRINEAEGYINGKLKVKFSIPFTAGSPPDTIGNIAKNLAGANCVRDLYADQTQQTTAFEKSLRDNAEAELDKILSGETTLVDSAGAAVAANDSLSSFTHENDLDPKFGIEDIDGKFREGDLR